MVNSSLRTRHYDFAHQVYSYFIILSSHGLIRKKKTSKRHPVDFISRAFVYGWCVRHILTRLFSHCPKENLLKSNVRIKLQMPMLYGRKKKLRMSNVSWNSFEQIERNSYFNASIPLSYDSAGKCVKRSIKLVHRAPYNRSNYLKCAAFE